MGIIVSYSLLFWPIDDIKVVPLSRITMLANNKIDREQVSKTPDIRDAYDASIAQLREDF